MASTPALTLGPDEGSPPRGLPPPAEPDLGRVLAAGAEHGVEVLGPPPG